MNASHILAIYQRPVNSGVLIHDRTTFKAAAHTELSLPTLKCKSLERLKYLLCASHSLLDIIAMYPLNSLCSALRSLVGNHSPGCISYLWFSRTAVTNFIRVLPPSSLLKRGYTHAANSCAILKQSYFFPCFPRTNHYASQHYPAFELLSPFMFQPEKIS